MFIQVFYGKVFVIHQKFGLEILIQGKVGRLKTNQSFQTSPIEVLETFPGSKNTLVRLRE